MGELVYYFGGQFVADPYLRYMGAQIMSYGGGDPDLLDFWELVRLGKECVKHKVDKEVEGIYLHLPGTPFEVGLMKLQGDKEVVEVGKVVERHGKAELYVVQRNTFAKVSKYSVGELGEGSKMLIEKENLSDVVSPTCDNKDVINPDPTPTTTPINDKQTSNLSHKTPTRSTSLILELLQSQEGPTAKQQKTSSPSPHNSLTTRSKVKATSTSPETLQKSTRSKTQSLQNSPSTAPSTTAEAIPKSIISTAPPQHPPPQQPPITNFREKLPIKSIKKSAKPIIHLPSSSKDTPSKNIQKGKGPADLVTPQENEADCDDWLDNRPDSPIPLDELVGSFSSDVSEYIPSDNASDDEEDQLCTVKGKSDKLPLVTEEGQELVVAEVNYREESDDEELDARSVSLDDVQSDDELAEAVGALSEWEKNRKKQVELAWERVLKQLGSGEEARKENADGDSELEVSDDENVLDRVVDSDDELICDRNAKVPVVTKQTDFAKFRWVPGIRFKNREDFRDALTRYCLIQGRNCAICRSHKQRGWLLEVTCKEGCPFRLYASWDKKEQVYFVKSVRDTHSCTRDIMSNRQLRSKWVAQELLELFKLRPHIPGKEIATIVKRSFNVVIKKDFAYKIKHVAHTLLHGLMQEHYEKVGRYIQALLQYNPSSVFIVESVPPQIEGPPVFRRLFVCFEGLKEGYLSGCRRVLCLDGCFLKTFLGGVLLVAVGKDANDQTLPLSWAVAEGENNDSWNWFLENLRVVVGGTDGTGWTVISDQQKGLLNAVAKVLPNADHRNCARHIYQNWVKTYKGDEFKSVFWAAVSAYGYADFQKAITKMKTLCPEAAEAFLNQDPRTFCRSFFDTTTKCDLVVNNQAETFNAWIVDARSKHLIYMLEDIRHTMMKTMSERRKWMEKSLQQLCPKIQKKLEKSKELAAHCEVALSTGLIFEVKYGLDDLVVNMDARTCTCRRWDLSGVPCAHAAAVATWMRRQPEEFVHPMLTKAAYLKAYNYGVGPCVGEKHWPECKMDLAPPELRAMPGRPKKTRIRSKHEDPKKPGRLTKHGVIMHCSLCKSAEHTKRKCPTKDKQSDGPNKRQKTGASSSKATSSKGTSKAASKGNSKGTSKGNAKGTSKGNSKGTAKGKKGVANIDVNNQVAVQTRKGRGRGKGVRGKESNGDNGSGRGRGNRGKKSVPAGAGLFVDTNTGQSYINSPGMSQPMALSSLSTARDGIINTQASTSEPTTK